MPPSSTHEVLPFYSSTHLILPFIRQLNHQRPELIISTRKLRQRTHARVMNVNDAHKEQRSYQTETLRNYIDKHVYSKYRRALIE